MGIVHMVDFFINLYNFIPLFKYYNDIMKLFVFWATGDLFKRKVLENIQNLKMEELQIIAIWRKSFTDELYQNFVCDDKCEDWFKKNISYKEIEFDENVMYDCCKLNLERDNINYFYASLPPQWFSSVISVLWKIFQEWYKVKLLLEKPFWQDLEHAQKLKDMLVQKKLVNNTYLVDHYLFKEEILKLKPIEFTSFEIWATETLWLENRAGYYEWIWALKDMVQSHFINILAKILPINERVVQNMTIKSYVRGQYSWYSEELWKESSTDTFVSLELSMENKVIRFVTWKAMNQKKTWIKIDDETIELSAKSNEYSHIFTSFFESKIDDFPTIEQSILAWKMISKIIEHNPPLISYAKWSSSDEVRK